MDKSFDKALLSVDEGHTTMVRQAHHERNQEICRSS